MNINTYILADSSHIVSTRQVENRKSHKVEIIIQELFIKLIITDPKAVHLVTKAIRCSQLQQSSLTSLTNSA